MKTHTTNYVNTFIEIAEDCLTIIGEIPPPKGDKQTVATIQFDMIKQHPYKYSSDEVIFNCYAVKNELTTNELASEKQKFFSKGQPCLRTSALTKRYGWGVHFNAQGKVAIYGAETKEYETFATDKKINNVKAMRSKKE